KLGLTTRGTLVIGQVALSIVLLIGASLLIESVLYLSTTNPGFNTEHLLTTQVALPPLRYSSDQKRTEFFQALVQRVQSIPGVYSATAALTLPMTPFPGTPVQDAAKPPLKLNERPIATALIVLPGYFRTLKIPFRRGRDFAERDGTGAQRVAIIDEDLARRFWASYPNSENPIGQRLLIGGVNPQPAEIIGIVAHVRQNLEDNAWRETVYTSFAQNTQSHVMLAVRTRWSPMQFTAAVRRAVQALDRDQSITAVRTMADLIDAQLGQRHSMMMLLGTFAALAVLLAAIGLYGLIAYSVVWRAKELGIRRALGARQIEIFSEVMGPALGLTLAGVIVGIGAALALTRFLQGLLFHISATDPATFAGIALLLIVVAGIASYIPARRATQIDPMAALRIE
ncbi:MAG: ABC transporter permease, partial [Terriglobales bacterium]